MRNALPFTLILLAGCSAIDNIAPRDNGYARERAMAEIAIVSTTSEQTPSPDDGGGVDVGDPCPDCNDPPGACGVGRVGDGRHCTRCRECGGDGRIDRDDLEWIRLSSGKPAAAEPVTSAQPADDCCGEEGRSYVLQRGADEEIDTQEIDLQEIGLQRIHVQEIGERRYGAAERTKEIVLRMTLPTRDGWPNNWYGQKRQQFEEADWTVRAQLDPASEHDVAFFDVYTPSGKLVQFYEPIELGDVKDLE